MRKPLNSAGLSDAEKITEAQEAEAQERLGWNGDYDGTECPNCRRERVILCGNGRRICEKCYWDVEAMQYSSAPRD